MKISVSWLFDYIDCDKSKIKIEDIVQVLNQKIAEVESFERINLDLNSLFLGQAIDSTSNFVTVYLSEIDKTLEMEPRKDYKKNSWYLILKKDNDFYWAWCKDVGADKEAVFPALYIDEKITKGEWRNSFENEDYILDISNTSITHRPDLWCHKGIAKEVAIGLQLPFKNPKSFLTEIDIIKTSSNFARQDDFEISIKDPQMCKRLSALYINQIDNVPSLLKMATRIARVGTRPISAIVDTTNYVMLDIGQPMHAFDASFFDNKFFARGAKEGERLEVLDEDEVELVEQDCVISSEDKLASLAGIMGGLDSSVVTSTEKVILEAACFDAETIRKTSSRVKKRTESSARYEKGLNPNNTVSALQRFVYLFKKNNLNIEFNGSILSVGKERKSEEIIVEHDFIEKKLGISIEPNIIVEILNLLGFEVVQDSSTYKVIIDPSRSKDLTIPEDIVEEIIRVYGYDKIPYDLPTKETFPHDLSSVFKIRNIKRFLAYSANMMEVSAYPFYDQEFLDEIDFVPEKTIEVLNPQSQNWTKLVTSLVPHLLKAIKVNLHKSESMRFFEIAKTWKFVEDKGLELDCISGIFFEYSKEINFLLVKQYLENLFLMLNLPIEWRLRQDKKELVQDGTCVEIYLNDFYIGYLGLVDTKILSKITEKGSAYIFELDKSVILNFNSKPIKFEPISKYQDVHLDVSMISPLNLKVKDLESLIKESSDLITEVKLIDLFNKKDWKDKQSLTFRYVLQHPHKTLTKEEIEEVSNKVIENISQKGVEVR